MRQNDAFIVSAVRTPIGKFLGALSSKKAHRAWLARYRRGAGPSRRAG